MTFYDWVREEARLIHADGCSGVTNIDGICCLIHDVDFYYGRSAASAYQAYRAGVAQYWKVAAPITFEQANRNIKACCFRDSILGYWNPIGWWRYWGARTKKGRAAWDAHRTREREPR